MIKLVLWNMQNSIRYIICKAAVSVIALIINNNNVCDRKGDYSSTKQPA